MASAVAATTAKAIARSTALARRDALPEATRAAAARVVAARPFPLAIRDGLIVSGYMPVRSEFDPRPLMQQLAAQGAQLAMPAVDGRDRPLTMRRWHEGDVLIAGPFDVLQPALQAEEVMPDIVLVPLAAFDRAGHRIGYGAGFYDRTLAQLRAKPKRSITAIGLAYAVQEVDAVAASGHDERLDLVLTERETIDLRSS